MMPAAIRHLLAAVRRRHHLVRLARLGFTAFIGCAALFAAVLLLSRLSGVLPLPLTPITVVIPLLAALAWAVTVVALRRPTPAAAIARLVDQQLGTNDLFLTAQAIGGSAGAYQELVLARAAERAAKVRAATIQPFTPWGGSGIVVAISATLAVGVWLVPQLDPFGRQAEHARQGQRERQLQLAQQAAKARVEALAQAQTDEPTSAAVAQELARLAATLDQLKADQALNRQQLNAEQRQLGTAFKQALERQPFATDQDPSGDLQRLGAGDLSKAEALRQELAKGDSRAVHERLEQLKEVAERLAASTDPSQQQQLRNELKKGLEQLAGATGKTGQQAQQALKQALDQLAQSGNPGTTKQALAALKDSLDLAKAELSAVAQGARDLDQLKEALQTLQMARQLNELGDLSPSDSEPGGKQPGKKSLADYKKLYAQLMQERGQDGNGGKGKGGMGPNPGQGDGGKGKENDAATMLFDPQRSRSQLTAGQTLMQWKTNGPAEAGIAEEDYRRSLSEVRQGVSEALLHEQLPPGYQEAVKKYFDTLEPAAGSGK